MKRYQMENTNIGYAMNSPTGEIKLTCLHRRQKTEKYLFTEYLFYRHLLFFIYLPDYNVVRRTSPTTPVIAGLLHQFPLFFLPICGLWGFDFSKDLMPLLS